jgi:hypothetical protein
MPATALATAARLAVSLGTEPSTVTVRRSAPPGGRRSHAVQSVLRIPRIRRCLESRTAEA